MADGPRFNVTIKTGDATGAGTDGGVYVKFVAPIQHGNGEETSAEVLLDAAGNDFEQGDVWTYPVTINRSFAEISHIEVRLDMTQLTLANAWQLDWIVVEDLDSHKVWEARANSWFDHTQDAMRPQVIDTRIQRFALVPVTPTTQYRFTVGTSSGTFSGAGTDGFVFMGLSGDAGNHITPLIYLDGPGNDFEIGSQAVYGPYTYPALNPPRTLNVRLDLRHPGDAWQLGWVGVEDVSTGKKYVAEVGNDWLDGPIGARVDKSYPLIEKDF